MSVELFPARIPIGQFIGSDRQPVRVNMTPEFYRALQDVLRRIGGTPSEVPDLDQIFFEAMSAPVSADSGSIGAFDMTAQAQHGDAQDLRITDLMQSPAIAPTELPTTAFQPVLTQAIVDSPLFANGQADGSPMSFRALTVTASPMTINTDRRCAIHIKGAVTALAYKRAGVNLDVAGNTTIEMNQGDALTVQYTTAPVITLIPR